MSQWQIQQYEVSLETYQWLVAALAMANLKEHFASLDGDDDSTLMEVEGE